jgi:hypothetical protein
MTLVEALSIMLDDGYVLERIAFNIFTFSNNGRIVECAERHIHSRAECIKQIKEHQKAKRNNPPTIKLDFQQTYTRGVNPIEVTFDSVTYYNTEFIETPHGVVSVPVPSSVL